MMWQDSVAFALRSVLQGSSVTFPPKLLQKESKESLASVDEFIASAVPGTISTGERKAIYDLLARLAAERASTISHKAAIPLSLKLILSTTKEIRGIFDLAFPGYLASGLAFKALVRSSV